jgi:carboxypeptidase family protein
MSWKVLATSAMVCFTSLVMVTPAASAQGTASGMAGVVRDTSGAVMPGVTVEAASPALIERVRSSVTDGEGLFKIVDLRPGVYTVTFTLTGFNTVKREGVDLPSGFTATVNAELRVGAVEETVTVSAATPVVDVQSNKDQKVLSQEVLEALPAQRNPNAYTPLLPGVVGQLGVLGVFGGVFTISSVRL